MQCCGARAESRGAEIKLPLGAEAGAGSSSGSIITDLKNFVAKIKVTKSFCVNFNPTSQVKKGIFLGIL